MLVVAFKTYFLWKHYLINHLKKTFYNLYNKIIECVYSLYNAIMTRVIKTMCVTRRVNVVLKPSFQNLIVNCCWLQSRSLELVCQTFCLGLNHSCTKFKCVCRRLCMLNLFGRGEITRWPNSKNFCMVINNRLKMQDDGILKSGT